MRPLGPLDPTVAPPKCGPGPDLPVSNLHVWTEFPGTAPAGGGALARCYGSGLLTLRLPWPHRPAVSPDIAGVVEAVRSAMAPASRSPRSFCAAARRFYGRPGWNPKAPESEGARWLAVAAVHPLGDCDRPGLETSPDS